jgi:hypothetical protein
MNQSLLDLFRSVDQFNFVSIRINFVQFNQFIQFNQLVFNQLLNQLIVSSLFSQRSSCWNFFICYREPRALCLALSGGFWMGVGYDVRESDRMGQTIQTNLDLSWGYRCRLNWFQLLYNTSKRIIRFVATKFIPSSQEHGLNEMLNALHSFLRSSSVVCPFRRSNPAQKPRLQKIRHYIKRT